MIAFKDYRMRDGILGSAWVGLKHFQNILSDFYMGNAVMNTIGLSLLSILISVPVTLIFAILIKELSNTALKRTVQTISYLPHFISWAIMAVLLDNFLNVNDGIINIVIKALGESQSPLLRLEKPLLASDPYSGPVERDWLERHHLFGGHVRHRRIPV
ncbi:MAG: hypothetical protein ACLR23_19950 [Clostridia bacterium]